MDIKKMFNFQVPLSSLLLGGRSICDIEICRWACIWCRAKVENLPELDLDGQTFATTEMAEFSFL